MTTRYRGLRRGTALRAFAHPTAPPFVLASVCPALAQQFPTRSIRAIVGPGPDIIPRLFAPKLTEVLGQQVIVEPKPGAGGVIAAQAVANAPPDGYLLLQATASYTINTALQSSAYDMRKDFAPVTLVSTISFVLVVHPSVPGEDAGRADRLRQGQSGQAQLASSGIGTRRISPASCSRRMAGIDIVHVPFREANSALNAVISGATQMSFVIASIAQSQMSGGMVRGLAVTSKQASPLVPGVRPVAEAGLPGSR